MINFPKYPTNKYNNIGVKVVNKYVIYLQH